MALLRDSLHRNPSPEQSGFQGDGDPQPELGFVCLDRMLGIEMVLPAQMEIVDGLEWTSAETTRNVLDSVAGLPPLLARHGGILRKGRGYVSDSIAYVGKPA